MPAQRKTRSSRTMNKNKLTRRKQIRNKKTRKHQARKMVGGAPPGGRTPSFHGKSEHTPHTETLSHIKALNSSSNSNATPLLPQAPKKPSKAREFFAGIGIGRKSYAERKKAYNNYHTRLAAENAAEKARIAEDQAREKARLEQVAAEQELKAKPVRALHELHNKLNMIKYHVLDTTQKYKPTEGITNLLNVKVEEPQTYTYNQFGNKYTYTFKPDINQHVNKLAEIISKYNIGNPNLEYHNVTFEEADKPHIDSLLKFYNTHTRNINDLHNKAMILNFTRRTSIESVNNSDRWQYSVELFDKNQY